MSVYKKMSDYALVAVINDGYPAVDVITIDEKNDSLCSWYYKVQVKHPFEEGYLVLKRESGTGSFCDCSSCQYFGDSRNELCAIYKAIKWINGNCKTTAVNIYTVSVDVDFEDYFDSEESAIECQFLRDIDSEMRRIGGSLNIKFIQTTTDESAWRSGLGEL